MAVSKRRTPKQPAPDVVYDDQGERAKMLKSDDPLTRAMAPPPNETPQQRAERLAAAAEALRISDLIDEELNRQRAAEKKGQRPVKILLLGQSESGKSTTLKNFQLMNSPKAFRAERLSWRAVVQLNVVRSVRLILDAIADQAENQGLTATPRSSTSSRSSGHGHNNVLSQSQAANLMNGHPPNGNHNGVPKCAFDENLVNLDDLANDPDLIWHEHLQLRRRLLPLLDAESVLLARLMPVAAAAGASLREIENSHAPNGVNGSSRPSTSEKGIDDFASQHQLDLATKPKAGTGTTATLNGKEVSVFAGSAWKTAFSRMLSAGRGSGDKLGIGEDGIDWDDPRDPTRVLNACGSDLMALWTDVRVRALLKRNKLRLEEMPGFFMDSIDRITSLNYSPTDDDILRARLKTLGVTEYRFKMKAAGNAMSHDWRVYDVGGQRSLRAAWVPFFDDMNAIIFLAPVSCFDQVLMEDQTVNRLEDSVLLWKSVVSNQLLAKTNLVLFLNKCDVLRMKLRAGIRLGKYVISYGDRPNDFEHASEYLKRKFYNIHHDHSPQPRTFYSHFTSVTDTKTTMVILENVADMILRSNLKNSSLIG